MWSCEAAQDELGVLPVQLLFLRWPVLERLLVDPWVRKMWKSYAPSVPFEDSRSILTLLGKSVA